MAGRMAGRMAGGLANAVLVGGAEITGDGAVSIAGGLTTAVGGAVAAAVSMGGESSAGGVGNPELGLSGVSVLAGISGGELAISRAIGNDELSGVASVRGGGESICGGRLCSTPIEVAGGVVSNDEVGMGLDMGSGSDCGVSISSSMPSGSASPKSISASSRVSSVSKPAVGASSSRLRWTCMTTRAPSRTTPRRPVKMVRPRSMGVLSRIGQAVVSFESPPGGDERALGILPEGGKLPECWCVSKMCCVRWG